MWPASILSSLDTASKGLRDVQVEPRAPADLWIRGSGTLDEPAKEWSFESSLSNESLGAHARASPSSSRGHLAGEVERDDRISYPLRVKFEVALVGSPECELLRVWVV
jgi:hypothetical protein